MEKFTVSNTMGEIFASPIFARYAQYLMYSNPYSEGAGAPPDIGYKVYGMPKPLALLPIYTFVDLKAESKRDENGGLLEPMFGPEYMKYLERFNIVEHVDGDYPPSYIVCGKDDNTVPPANSVQLKAKLDAAGVPAILEEGEHAPHGFGDGTGTDVDGWPERAIEFICKLK